MSAILPTTTAVATKSRAPCCEAATDMISCLRSSRCGFGTSKPEGLLAFDNTTHVVRKRCALKATYTDEKSAPARVRVVRWDALKDGELSAAAMKSKLLQFPAAEFFMPFTTNAPPPYTYPLHSHDFPTWDGLLAGPVVLYIIENPDGSEETLTLEAGDIIELPAGVKHRVAAPTAVFNMSACAGGKSSNMQDIAEGTHVLESLTTAAAKAGT